MTAKMPGLVAIAMLSLTFAACSKGTSSTSAGSTAPGVTATLDASAATLSSGELAVSSGDVELQSTGNGGIEECTGTGSGGLALGPLDSITAGNPAIQDWDMYFTSAKSYLLTQVQVYAAEEGSPTGTVDIKLYINGNSYPQSVGTIDTSALTTSYVLTTVAMSPAIALSAGTQYSILLFGDTNYSKGTGGVYFQSMSAASCANSNFGTLYEDQQSGRSNTGESIDLHFMTSAYPTDGPTAAFTSDGGTAGDSWVTSSFNPNENPQAGTGAITYDLGASDTNSATYSQSGLTKAQVTALSNLTGRYVFIRAHLGSSGFNGSSLGNIAINHNP